MKMRQLTLINESPYQLTETGLVVAGESTEDDWQELGTALSRLDEARQWAIGDWLCDGKRHYGDGLYKQAAELLKLKEQTLKDFTWMAGVFEMSFRKDVSFAHHKEVASIKTIATDGDGLLYLSDEPDKDKMQELLADAEKKKWSVVELRNEVRAHKEWQRQHIAAANEPEKYAVVYADPPWQYNSGPNHTELGANKTTLADHYPSMPLDDICNLPQANLAATDCVLFLWCTSPTLEEAMEVINAWGFAYKASMIWDKVAHNVGHYVSVRHELLLICTKGQPPKVPKLVDSVYSEERTEHSRKPSYFRDLIDELYPNGKRIELFAREEFEGWEAWGNEIAAV